MYLVTFTTEENQIAALQFSMLFFISLNTKVTQIPQFKVQINTGTLTPFLQTTECQSRIFSCVRQCGFYEPIFSSVLR